MGRNIDENPDDYVDPNGDTFDSRRRRRENVKVSYADRPTERERDEEQGDDADDGEKTFRPRPKWVDTADNAADVLPAGFLVVIDGPGIGNALAIQAHNNVCGRSSNNDICIDFGDKEITRHDHVRFAYYPAKRQFRVIPGQGRMTLHKGEPLEMPQPLERGDVVQLGRTKLRFAPFCDADFDWDETAR